MSAGCGLLSRITAVYGSGVSTRSTASNMAVPKGWFLLDDGEREGDVVRRDRHAVVEAGVPGEMECVAPFVLGDLPALGQIGMGFELVVDPHQPGEELRTETGLGA